MEEIWRDIPCAELYQASNLGNIRSLNYRNQGITKVLKQEVVWTGYKRVTIRGTRFYVSRLVALAFPEICGKYFPGAEIDHINTNKGDNKPENLRWVDRSGNLSNPLTMGRRMMSLRNRTDESKWVIRLSTNNEILHFYPSISEAARATGVKVQNISKCCKGNSKTAGGYIWKYAI